MHYIISTSSSSELIHIHSHYHINDIKNLYNEFKYILNIISSTPDNIFDKIYESKNTDKFTAVIPAKKSSTRCKNKNIREFYDTNLIEKKIRQ